jgi:hypothetical protein
MRALAAAMALVLLGGCAADRGPATGDGGAEKKSYNRRELESRPGLLTGRDGVWTIQRSDGEPPPRPRTRTILLGEEEEPAASERR